MKELIGTWWMELSNHGGDYYIVCAVDTRVGERDNMRIVAPPEGIPLWLNDAELTRRFTRVRDPNKIAELELTNAEAIRDFAVSQRKHYDTYFKGPYRQCIITL